MSKSVAIVAMGKSSIDYLQVSAMNQGKTTDEVWAVNAMANVIKHDKAIIMDDLDELIKRLPNYIFVKSHDKPIVTSSKRDIAPKSESYPLEEVVNYIGMPYLNTTVSYAFALAMFEGFTTIHLYGADYTYKDIHIAESGRGNLEYLIGLATASGIQVGVAASSTLMDKNVDDDNKLYGYNGNRKAIPEFSDGRWKIKYEEK